jgi:NADPH:quinone reductase
MRALICESYEGIDSLRVGELPDPEQIPGTVLVRVEAAAVNFADSLIAAGQYQVRPELPFAIGSELAGVVEEASGVDGVVAGDRVAGFVGFGAMAERAVLFPNSIIKLPESLTYSEGAAVPVAYGTSYHALVDRADLGEGETLLVLGAAGGVGLAAVQIGKAIGARVIAVVSSDEKEEAAREAGAEDVIRYDHTSLREGIDLATGRAGVDVVYDPVGGEATELALRSTNWNGILLVVGFASGTIPNIPLNLTLVKGNAIVGVFWGRFAIEEPERSRENNAVIEEWLADGTIKPYVQRQFPLEAGAEAVRWVAERKVIGRVVVNP